MPLNEEEVKARLSERGVNNPCHRCGNLEFLLVKQCSRIALQPEVSGPMILGGGQSVPVVLVVCSKCGAITPHALGTLDLLPQQPPKADGKEKVDGKE